MSNAIATRTRPHVYPHGPARPQYQPRERFWPYAELPEQPTPEELAALDPDLHAALFGAPPRPFSFTLTFPRFDGARVRACCRPGARVGRVPRDGSGDGFRHRARFYPPDAGGAQGLCSRSSGRYDAAEVLVDDRPVPFARELWLPLLWMLTLRVPDAGRVLTKARSRAGLSRTRGMEAGRANRGAGIRPRWPDAGTLRGVVRP